MEVGSANQSAGQVAVNKQASIAPQVSEQEVVNDNNVAMQKDFQVNLNEGIKGKLAEFANLLQNREQFIKSLPADIQKAVKEILQQMSADAELPQGLSSLLTGQKNIAEQLKNMSNLLELTAVLNKGENGDVKALLQTVMENAAEQLTKTPEQSAKEILQLAKQLSAGTTVPQSDFKQAVKEYLQANLPKNMQQLNQNDQKIVNQLTKLLAKDMPAQLQQLAQDSNLPELPGTWATLKVVNALPFKDIQPKTLQAAADLLRQISDEMSPEKMAMTGQSGQVIKMPAEAGNKNLIMTQLEQFVKNIPTEVGGKNTPALQSEQFGENLPPDAASKGMKNGQLEQFLKTLPPEISKALQQVLKQGNMPANLRELADTFSQAAVLNERMTSEQQSFNMKTADNFTGKSLTTPTATSQVLTQLAMKFSDTATTLEQIKLLVKQLKTELLSGDPKTLEKEQQTLDQLTKLFEKNIPQALQEGATRHKLTELPKVWVLLKALGIEQWQNTGVQQLQESATLVKELAQSIYKSTGASGEKQAEHSVLTFSVPLQVAPGVHYPAHIHIYHQEKEETNSQLSERQFETWLRVCVDTENIGMVDSVFRLYGENKLDVRVTFPSTVAADEFSQELDDIKKNLDDTSLNLTEIMVNHI